MSSSFYLSSAESQCGTLFKEDEDVFCCDCCGQTLIWSPVNVRTVFSAIQCSSFLSPWTDFYIISLFFEKVNRFYENWQKFRKCAKIIVNYGYNERTTRRAIKKIRRN